MMVITLHSPPNHPVASRAMFLNPLKNPAVNCCAGAANLSSLTVLSCHTPKVFVAWKVLSKKAMERFLRVDAVVNFPVCAISAVTLCVALKLLKMVIAWKKKPLANVELHTVDDRVWTVTKELRVLYEKRASSKLTFSNQRPMQISANVVLSSRCTATSDVTWRRPVFYIRKSLLNLMENANTSVRSMSAEVKSFTLRSGALFEGLLLFVNAARPTWTTAVSPSTKGIRVKPVIPTKLPKAMMRRSQWSRDSLRTIPTLTKFSIWAPHWNSNASVVRCFTPNSHWTAIPGIARIFLQRNINTRDAPFAKRRLQAELFSSGTSNPSITGSPTSRWELRFKK